MNMSVIDSALPVDPSLAPALHIFARVARLEHVSEAAAELGIPQPTVSRSLARLQREIGVQLLVRAGRNVRLTPQGRALLATLEPALHAIQEGVRSIRSETLAREGLVRFGFPLSMGARTVPALLKQFSASFPHYRFELWQGHGGHLIERVLDGRLDLALVGPRPRNSQLRVIPCGRQRLYLFVAETHPLAARSRVSFEEIKAERFVALPADFHLRQLTDSFFDSPPQVVFESGEIETLHGLVATGFGVGILPAAQLERSDTVRIELRAPVPWRDMAIIHQAERQLPAPLEDFRDFLEVHAAGHWGR